MPFTRFVFCRHGQSENNVLQDISFEHYKNARKPDPALTGPGKQQAEAAGAEIARLILETTPLTVELWSSPMKRALQTANCLSLSASTMIAIQPDAFEAGGIFIHEAAASAGAAQAGISTGSDAKPSPSRSAGSEAHTTLELTLSEALELFQLDADSAASTMSATGWYHDKTYVKEPRIITLERARRVTEWVRQKATSNLAQSLSFPLPPPSPALGGSLSAPGSDGVDRAMVSKGSAEEAAALGSPTTAPVHPHHLVILVSHVVFLDSMVRFLLGGEKLGACSIHVMREEVHGDDGVEEGAEASDVVGTGSGSSGARERGTSAAGASHAGAARAPAAARLAWNNCGLTVIDCMASGEVVLQHANRTNHLSRAEARLELPEGSLHTGCKEAFGW